MLDRLTAEDFDPLRDSAFEILFGDGKTATLRLVEIGHFSPSGVGSRPAPFSLVFEGEAVARPSQGIYRLKHPDMPLLEIFLVPIGRAGDRIRYEAIFN